MDFMVGTALTIEREIEDARSTRDSGASGKRKESQSSSSSGKKPRASSVPESRSSGPGTNQGCQPGWADGVLPLPAAQTYEEGFPSETGIPGFRDSTVPISDRTGEDKIYSSTAQYRPEELVSVSGSFTGTFRYTGRPERPDYGSRQRTRPTGRDVKGSGACLRHYTTG